MYTQRVPILGQVAAGKPVEWLEIKGYRHIRPVPGTKPGEVVVIEIIGDSLKDDHILDGDIAVVRLNQIPRVGDLVVALTPDGLTIKYYYPQPDGQLFLMCANEEYEDQIWPAEDVIIRGVVLRTERDRYKNY